jgi:hypothetical protein
VTFPVWAFASDGARGSRVRVRFPAGYAVAVESGAFDTKVRTADGGTELATEPLGEPLDYFAYLSGQKAAVYKETPLTVKADDDQIDLSSAAGATIPPGERGSAGCSRRPSRASPRRSGSPGRSPGRRSCRRP